MLIYAIIKALAIRLRSFEGRINMLKRSIFKKIRQHACSIIGALLMIYALRNGADNSLATALKVVAIAICVYFIWGCIDRIIGLRFPVVIDLRSLINEGIDRSDPYRLAIIPPTGIEIDIEIDENDRIELLKIGDLKMRQSDREFCYLRVTDNRLIKADPDIAYTIFKMVRNNFGVVKVSGFSYQVS